MASRVLQRLLALREQAGLTQENVAARMGTSQPVVARLEAGGRDPRLSTLERYARAVGADLDVGPAAASRRGTAVRLAERIRDRLLAGELPSVTFREVVQFLDDLAQLEGDEVIAAVAAEPLSTGDRRWDATVAGAVDWAAFVHGIRAPRWTGSARCRIPEPGWFVTPHTRLHELVRASTPVAFSRHGVYVDQSSLTGL